MNKCLCCDGDFLHPFINLGFQPIANNYPDVSGSDETFPLTVNVCLDCGHSQLGIAIDPELLFKNYSYLSGVSQQNREYFKKFRFRCHGQSILDIGCNDGSLLEHFEGWVRYGVEPAINLTNMLKEKGICVITEFFPTPLSEKFDVITALNVFAHNSNPFEFLLGCKECLSDGGKLYIQTSQKDMLKNGEFDTIYHEHISFFTPNSMFVLCQRAGMILESIEEVDFQGNSYLFTIRKEVLFEHKSFKSKAEQVKEDLLRVIKHPLVAYTVPAKGVVLLNYCGITPEYAVEDNTLKQGKFIPGLDCPIHPSRVLMDDTRDLTILILAWNMYDEIKKKIQAVRGKRDRLIRVFPKLEVEDV